MAIIARYTEKPYSPCPVGVHQAVLVDVVDLGEVDTPLYGKKFKVRLAWQIGDVDPATGHRFSAVKTYNNTMNKKAALRGDLERWRGRPFSEDEAKRFNLETLIGVNCLLNVVHHTSERTGAVYANVDGVLPLPTGTKKLQPLDYVRFQDRATITTTPTSLREPGEDDDDISFSMQELDATEKRSDVMNPSHERDAAFTRTLPIGRMDYLEGHIGRAVVPAGSIVVHNHVRPARYLGTRGFRAWLTDMTNPRVELCDCGWAPELGQHFRVRYREGA